MFNLLDIQAKIAEMRHILSLPYQSEGRPGHAVSERQIYDARKIDIVIGLLAEIDLAIQEREAVKEIEEQQAKLKE